MVRMQLQALLARVEIENVDKRSFVTFGKPAEEIVRKGDELGPTAIVMCSSGKNTLTTFFVGSVCEKVLKSTKIPVMILK